MTSEIATVEKSFSVVGEGSEEVRALAQKAAQNLATGFTDTKNKMDELTAWKRKYDSRSAFGRWWDNDVMAEKRDEMILITMESAKQQMDVIKFIAWLNTQMLALQKTLNESQNQLKAQNVQLQNQQKVIQEQQQTLEDHQKHMEEENQKILEGCDVLRKLRSIVIGHEQTIGTNKNGIDELIVQLSEIYKDVGAFEKDSKKRDAELADKLRTQCESVDKAIREAARKTEDILRRTTLLASEVEAKFDKALAEIAETLRTAQEEIQKNGESTKESLTNRLHEEEDALNARVAEAIAGLQDEAAKLRVSCQERVDAFEERVSGLAKRYERAEVRIKRMTITAVVSVISSVAAVVVAVLALVK